MAAGCCPVTVKLAVARAFDLVLFAYSRISYVPGLEGALNVRLAEVSGLAGGVWLPLRYSQLKNDPPGTKTPTQSVTVPGALVMRTEICPPVPILLGLTVSVVPGNVGACVVGCCVAGVVTGGVCAGGVIGAGVSTGAGVGGAAIVGGAVTVKVKIVLCDRLPDTAFTVMG
jgi:hypothetical protein